MSDVVVYVVSDSLEKRLGRQSRNPGTAEPEGLFPGLAVFPSNTLFPGEQ